MAHAQLQILTDTDIPDEMWKLDDETIKIGRQGLAQARAALQEAVAATITAPVEPEPLAPAPVSFGRFAPDAFQQISQPTLLNPEDFTPRSPVGAVAA